MGVGGGGLFVIYLSLFTDIPHAMCQGINLLFFILAGGASMVIHFRKRHIFSLTLLLALTAMGGAILGIMFGHFIPDHILRKLFGTMLVITGIFSLKRLCG
jgi:uncharacterized membrane protein YfcA